MKPSKNTGSTNRSYRFGDFYTTVTVWSCGDGFLAHWWVQDLSAGRMIGTLTIPVYGDNLLIAANSTKFHAENIVDLFGTTWGGNSRIQDTPPNEQIFSHLQMYKEYSSKKDVDVLIEAANYHNLLTSFKCSNPARWTALILGVGSDRTIQDRFARARKAGLMQSPGQGKSF